MPRSGRLGLAGTARACAKRLCLLCPVEQQRTGSVSATLCSGKAARHSTTLPLVLDAACLLRLTVLKAPLHWLQGKQPWHVFFTRRLQGSVRAVSPTVSCAGAVYKGAERSGPHVTQGALALDRVRRTSRCPHLACRPFGSSRASEWLTGRTRSR